MNLIAGEKSGLCSEGRSLPATDTYLYFQDNITYCSEGAEMIKLIEHHTKYKEIHGIDETIWMTVSDHRKLHNRLRREGKCKISPKELKEIAKKAQVRTTKFKLYRQNYQANYLHKFSFTEAVERNVQLCENIIYNKLTGIVTINSLFKGHHNKKLIEVWI